MPPLTFPFNVNGLLLPAIVNLAAPDLQVLLATGQPFPSSQHVRGMIDTGTTITAVAPWVLNRLQVMAGPSTQTMTASGMATVAFYRISFTIHTQPVGSITIHRGDWMVISLPQDIDDVDVLFGVDLLLEAQLTVDGPGRTFSLDA